MKKQLLSICLGLMSLNVFAQWVDLTAPALTGSDSYDYEMLAVSNNGKNIAAWSSKIVFSPFSLSYKYVVSHDFGATWTENAAPAQIPGQMFWMDDVLFVKETLSDTLKKSIDFGASFTYQGTKNISLGSKIAVVNANQWLFQKSESGIYKMFNSTDQGISWNMLANVAVGVAPNFSPYVVLANGHIVSVSATGAQVVYSTDNGNTWTAATLPSAIGAYEHKITTGSNGSLMMFASNPVVPQLFKSQDNGVTWQTQSTNMPSNATAVLYHKEEMICLAKDASTHKSTDNGATFTQISAPNTLYTPSILGSKSLERSTSNLYTCGKNKIYRYGSGPVNGIAENKAQQNVKVYPNPTVDFITVESAIHSKITHLETKDITGKMVGISYTLNQHEATLNTASLEAGIYFVTIETTQGISTHRFTKR